MAKDTLKKQEALQQEKIDATVSKAETFLNENKKVISGILIAIVVVGLAVLAYNQFIVKPKTKEAMQQTYPAENSFASGNFEIALNGDGNNLGFAEIIDQYGAKAGKSVYFYAGVCELNLGNFESAISYLKKYKGTDEILKSKAIACIGDAYVALENYDEALKYFEKAADLSVPPFTPEFLLKAAAVYEETGKQEKALEYYKLIKDQYPSSIEAYDIDKYITRIENR